MTTAENLKFNDSEYTRSFTQPVPQVTRSAVHRHQTNVELALRRFSDPIGDRRGIIHIINKDDDVAPLTTITTPGPPLISINPVWQLPKKYRDKKKRRQEDMIRLAILSSSSGSNTTNNNNNEGGLLLQSSPAIHQELLHQTRKHAFNRSASEGNLDKLWVDTVNRNSLSLSSTGQLMDVTLVGKDDGLSGIRASRALLATDSFILEDIFFKNREWKEYNAMESTLKFEYATNDVLRALVYHNFNDKLPTDFDSTSPTDIVVRKLAQLYHVAYTYKFHDLAEDTNGALRKLINTRVVLACAAFDELSYQHGTGTVDSIKRYALDSIRDMPMDTLLAGGLQWMKEESVEAIILDEEMDVDEFYRFKILSVWANSIVVDDNAGGEVKEDRTIAASRLAKHIELKFIDTDLLLSQVQDSGYFDVNTINDAVKARRDSLANSMYEKECVLVEGAGSDIVNGIYCRENDEVGVGEEEILFVKEADDGYSDIGLYLYGTTWHIAMCADYSNSFYTCQDPLIKSNLDQDLVPSNQWVVMDGAVGPAPYCTYRRNAEMQGKRMRRSSLAPNLEEMIDPTIVEKRRSHCFDKTKGDVAEKRTMTLEQMMNLPVDQDCENYE
jgi:hypothetical protein